MAVMKYKDESTGEWISVGAPINASNLQMDLLWENASLSSEFAAQTISLDLTEYSGVYVAYYYHITGTTEVDNLPIFSFSVKGVKSILNSGFATNGYRLYTVNDDGIVFESGKGFLTYNSVATNVNNKYCTPVAIYGVK